MTEQRTAAVFAPDGKPAGEVELEPSIFGIEPNVAVMHQVVTAQRAAARTGTASTKTRAEVRGGGAKPWRQKGLGRARHGSIRSPQWTGGGVAFGPKPRSYAQRTPKKMRRLALRGALSARAADSRVMVIDEFDWAEPKTKRAADLLETVGAAGKVLAVLEPNDFTAELSFRNLARVLVTTPGQLTTYDVLWSDTVLFTRESLAAAGNPKPLAVISQDFVQ